LKVEMEVTNEETAKELEKSMPRMRDALILLLSSKTYLDLASYQGKQQLKAEIKQKVTALPGGKNITDVFFTEFVAQ
jgi:flagellar FliL protein